jgi:dynein intermediate chain 1
MIAFFKMRFSSNVLRVVRFSGTVSQWDIYDSYIKEHKNHLQDEDNTKNLEKKKLTSLGIDNGVIEVKKIKETDLVHSTKMASTLKILERMVNQNAEDEIFQDFKFWEDESDVFQPGKGSLLPLWRFSTERCKRKHVTALKWNSIYHDLFAVGYGSYDFLHQGSGVICCYSLKNTSHPEYVFTTESGVMCLDFHPQHNALLAVGCYDGIVMVFDIRLSSKKPLYCSSIKSGQHTDPVWQVIWQEEEIGKELSFFSVSSDGLIACWTMSKNELKMEVIMQLKLLRLGKDEPDEMSFSGLASGCCFDFSRWNDHMFLVGTEEGRIHKCSKAYSGQYLETYTGHNMAVYTVKWNPFHSNVFVSCSADWYVKIWDQTLTTPIFSFDMGIAVGDVAWSPHLSTNFAAVTSDGKVTITFNIDMFIYT